MLQNLKSCRPCEQTRTPERSFFQSALLLAVFAISAKVPFRTKQRCNWSEQTFPFVYIWKTPLPVQNAREIMIVWRLLPFNYLTEVLLSFCLLYLSLSLWKLLQGSLSYCALLVKSIKPFMGKKNCITGAVNNEWLLQEGAQRK